MLLFIDSFDHYATADIAKKWTGGVIGGSIGAYGRRGSNGIRGPAVTVNLLNPAPSGTTFVVGVAVYCHGPLSSLSTQWGTNHISFYGSGFPLCSLHINPTGTISVGTHQWNGADVTVLGTTSNAIVEDVWHFIEWKVTIGNGTAGATAVRIDGTEGLNISSIDTSYTGVTTVDALFLASGMGTVTHDYDDLYLLDGSGSKNNNFLGDCRVDAKFPESPAGNSSQWTRSTGADQWATVDEATPNGDTDYNESDTVSEKDTLNFGSAPVAGAAIHGVQVNLYATKTDTGPASVAAVARIGGSDFDGGNRTLAQGYAYHRQVWDQTPEGSPQDWTDTIFNAAEFGYKRTA